MNLEINGKVALVLAAGGGLGKAIALTLAREGARVAISDLNEKALKETAAAIEAGGFPVFSYRADLADKEALAELERSVAANLGPIDILINNTGGPPPSTVSGISPDVWRSYFESMVVSVIGLTDLVLPGMRQRKWGRIITSTSSGVIAPIANLGLSNALRSTLVGWSKTLAREVANDGITANIVLPGRVATARITMLDEARARREGRSVEEIAAESIRSIPVGRYGDPQEYADAVAFLASARASYINGTILRVDGGMLANV